MSGITPWDEGCYVYMDRDIRNLGYKCVTPDCNAHATHEIGINGDHGGDLVFCLCDEHSKEAEDMFWEEMTPPSARDIYDRKVDESYAQYKERC